MSNLLSQTEYEQLAGNLTFLNKAFINGEFVDALSGHTFETENPATGEVLTAIAECDADDVNLAVMAARASFDSGVWARLHPAERKAVLLKYADLVELHSEELALLDSLEAGKPIAECVNTDIPETVLALRWYAEAVDKVFDQISPSGSDCLGLIRREALGVVGAVLPWNFPAMMVAWKIGPALAAGNSIVVKPAEQTSLSTLKLAQLAGQAGIPAGVFNVVTGFGESAGQALGRHNEVDVLTFTGSTEVGRYFLKYSAESNLKRVVLECGGKSPQVVMADAADLDSVAENAVAAAFWNMGENCTCGSRLIVHKDVKEELLGKLIEKTAEWKIGSPLNPEVLVGSMIEKSHMSKVVSYIEAGLAGGAKLVLGGTQVRSESGGYFVEPTIFDDVTNDMKIAQEEIFGPVLSVISFKTVEEAIQIANDTPYGLAASVYTQSLSVAHKLTNEIKAGTVSVNCFSEGDISTPFGGYKTSGFGGKDKGLQAIEQYTEVKTIWYDFQA